jgi:hypothetical protein
LPIPHKFGGELSGSLPVPRLFALTLYPQVSIFRKKEPTVKKRIKASKRVRKFNEELLKIDIHLHCDNIPIVVYKDVTGF